MSTRFSQKPTEAPRNSRVRHQCITAALVCLAVLTGMAWAAASREAGEYEVKAAFLFKIAHYVHWPEEAFPEKDTPFRIGVVGKNPFGKLLDELGREKKVADRQIEIVYWDDWDPEAPCHMVFISDSESERVDTLLAAIGSFPALTVSDMEGFAEAQGIVELFRKKTNIHLRINLDAAESHQLQISSRLLQLAEIHRNE